MTKPMGRPKGSKNKKLEPMDMNKISTKLFEFSTNPLEPIVFKDNNYILKMKKIRQQLEIVSKINTKLLNSWELKIFDKAQKTLKSNPLSKTQLFLIGKILEKQKHLSNMSSEHENIVFLHNNFLEKRL